MAALKHLLSALRIHACPQGDDKQHAAQMIARVNCSMCSDLAFASMLTEVGPDQAHLKRELAELQCSTASAPRSSTVVHVHGPGMQAPISQHPFCDNQETCNISAWFGQTECMINGAQDSDGIA